MFLIGHPKLTFGSFDQQDWNETVATVESSTYKNGNGKKTFYCNQILIQCENLTLIEAKIHTDCSI